MINKRGWRKIGTWLALWSMVSWLVAIPLKINYQGRLTNNNSPVTATKTMYFSIKESSGGTTVWGPVQQSVSVVNGLYNVVLEPPQTVFETDQQLQLHIKVDSIDLSPDIMLLAVPYAYKAKATEVAETITANQTAGDSILEALTQASDVNIQAGGTNKNIALTPSGTGSTVLNGPVYLTGSAGGVLTSANNTLSFEY